MGSKGTYISHGKMHEINTGDVERVSLKQSVAKL